MTFTIKHEGSPQVLDAIRIENNHRNLSFLDGKNILPDRIEISDLNILFKKITQ